MTRRLPALLLLVALSLPLAACGGDDGGSGGGASPAAAVPATAPIYAELAVRPEGDLRSDVEAAAKKVLRTDDAGKRARELFDRMAGDEVRWADVEGWLGERVGVFFTSLDGEEPEGALVGAVTDEGEARDGLRKLVADEGRRAERSHKGVDYEVAGDTAIGVVGDHAVLGSESGLKAVIDVDEGADDLAGVPAYERAVQAAKTEGSLGHAYVDTRKLLSAVGDLSKLGPAESFVRGLVDQIGDTAVARLSADGDGIRVAGVTIGGKAPATRGSGADVVAELPDDAWLAAGAPAVGESVRKVLDQLGEAGAQEGLDELERQSGLDVEEDLLSWMGDAAIYARGTALADIGAVVTLETTDREKSDKTVELAAKTLEAQGMQIRTAEVDGYDKAWAVRIDDFPIPLYLAAGSERVSFGVNPEALAAVAAPSQTLRDSDRYRAAADLLGDGLKPSFIVDMPTIVRLLDGLSAFIGAEQLDQIRPYLESFGVIAAGGARDGDVQRGTLAVGLR